MSKIACDQRYHCPERLRCGATLPHTVGGYEQCLVEKTARYEEVAIMPKALTAENGAKSLLIGEFYEEITVKCPECWDLNEDANEDCEICGGTGEYVKSVPVSWTTIKEIYAMAVKRLGGEL